MKRFISVFLIILSFVLLVACAHEDADTNATDESTTDAATTTEAAETDPPEPEKLILVEDGKTDFRVIRS